MATASRPWERWVGRRPGRRRASGGALLLHRRSVDAAARRAVLSASAARRAAPEGSRRSAVCVPARRLRSRGDSRGAGRASSGDVAGPVGPASSAPVPDQSGCLGGARWLSMRLGSADAVGVAGDLCGDVGELRRTASTFHQGSGELCGPRGPGLAASATRGPAAVVSSRQTSAACPAAPRLLRVAEALDLRHLSSPSWGRRARAVGHRAARVGGPAQQLVQPARRSVRAAFAPSVRCRSSSGPSRRRERWRLRWASVNRRWSDGRAP